MPRSQNSILGAVRFLGLPRGWSGRQRQRSRDTPELWNSLETLGDAAKLAPRDERLDVDTPRTVHLDHRFSAQQLDSLLKSQCGRAVFRYQRRGNFDKCLSSFVVLDQGLRVLIQ
jgi:hypothetical protein